MAEPRVIIATDVVERLANQWVDHCIHCQRERGSFAVALSGGSTPLALYRRLAAPDLADRVDWRRVEVFFGDERAVPPDDAASNYGMALKELLQPLGLRDAQVHRMCGEAGDPHAAADEYARLLERRLPRDQNGVPVLDLILLGMGEDGHVASLFPGSDALGVRDRWVIATRSPQPPAFRLTITFPVIEAARAVWLLVTGARKREALAEVLSGARSDLPAGQIAAAPNVCWFVDVEASEGSG